MTFRQVPTQKIHRAENKGRDTKSHGAGYISKQLNINCVTQKIHCIKQKKRTHLKKSHMQEEHQDPIHKNKNVYNQKNTYIYLHLLIQITVAKIALSKSN